MTRGVLRLVVGLLVSVLICHETWAQAGAESHRTGRDQRGTANAPDATQVVDAAATNMGATNLKTIEFSGSGFVFRHGQALVRFGPLPRFDLKSFTYVADYVTPGSRVERVRVQGSNPPRGGSPQPLVAEERTIAYLNGEYGWGMTIGGSAFPSATPPTPSRQPGGAGLDAGIIEERQIQLWETPHGFLIAASRSATPSVKEQRISGRRFRVVSFPRGNTRMDGYVNDENLVDRVETWIAHPVLGDMSIERAK